MLNIIMIILKVIITIMLLWDIKEVKQGREISGSEYIFLNILLWFYIIFQ